MDQRYLGHSIRKEVFEEHVHERPRSSCESAQTQEGIHCPYIDLLETSE